MFNDATPNERLIMVTRFVRRKTKLLFFETNNFLIKIIRASFKGF